MHTELVHRDINVSYRSMNEYFNLKKQKSPAADWNEYQLMSSVHYNVH